MNKLITLDIDDVWVRHWTPNFSLQLPWSRQPHFRLRPFWSVRPFRKVTLSQASLKIEPGKLVAIIGPNGAGKTTLMRAVAGERPTRGDVRLNGQSLFTPGSPEYWLPRIGYVPVDNVLHEQLTVYRALLFLSRIRLPGLSKQERRQRVEEQLTKFALPKDRWRQRIRTLSSGERKRVNICAELLTEPMLLLLDEPTSNLDPNAERELMEILRERATTTQQTIVLVTHTLNTLYLCDRVIFIANGEIIADDSPDHVMNQLAPFDSRGKDTFHVWSDIFDKKKTEERRDQAALHRMLMQRPHPPARGQRISMPRAAEQKTSIGAQFWVLLTRYLLLQWSNLGSACIKLALGAIGGLCLIVLPDDSFIRNAGGTVDMGDARNGFFQIGLVIVLIGMISSFQEVSNEWRIYQHERLKGLSPWTYLASKWAVLNIMVGVIAPIVLVLMLIFLHDQPLQPAPPASAAETVPRVHGVVLAAQMPWFQQVSALVPLGVREALVRINAEALFSLILACIAATTLGLLISAAGRTDKIASGLLAVAVIFHVFLSGLSSNSASAWIIDPLSNFATSHWAIRGFSVSSAVYCWTNPVFKEFYSLGFLGSIWIALLGYIAATLGLAYLALRWRDSWAPWHVSVRRVCGERLFICLILVVGICVSWSFFWRERSREYFELQANDIVARVSDIPRTEFSWFQWGNGLVSQAQCPRPSVHPIPAPSVAPAPALTPVSANPTPVAIPTQPEPTATPMPTSTPTPTATATLTPAATAALTPIVPPGPGEPAVSEVVTSTEALSATVTPSFTPVPVPPTATPSLTPMPVPPTELPTSTVPVALPALPTGKVTADTPLTYGPLHPNLTTLEAGSTITLLARDRTGGWLRVLWSSPDGSSNFVGWVEASNTDLNPRNTSAVPIPPACARPIALMTEAEPTWSNTGQRLETVLVIDVFRATSGDEVPATQLRILANNQPLNQIQIPATRGSFLLQRSTVSNLNIPADATIEVKLENYPSDGDPVAFFGTLFQVPANCTFQ